MTTQANNYIFDQIRSYDGSLSRLGCLIADLDAIWESRTDWPEMKRRSFRSNWGVLEQIYAGVLDKQSRKLSAQDVLDSRTALKAIKEQLTESAPETGTEEVK